MVLDVIDPVLQNIERRDEMIAMLRHAGLTERVTLHAAASPAHVQALGSNGARWSFVFIDGDHDSPAPARDALACIPFLESDAMILFHDLMAPDVAEALAELRARGWATLIYQTSQIMAAAWQGSVVPIAHRPDPKLDWDLPTHLMTFAVSGEPLERRGRTLFHRDRCRCARLLAGLYRSRA